MPTAIEPPYEYVDGLMWGYTLELQTYVLDGSVAATALDDGLRGRPPVRAIEFLRLAGGLHGLSGRSVDIADSAKRVMATEREAGEAVRGYAEGAIPRTFREDEVGVVIPLSACVVACPICDREGRWSDDGGFEMPECVTYDDGLDFDAPDDETTPCVDALVEWRDDGTIRVTADL